ncbi:MULTISPECIES: hypothetical protein [Pseudomonadaceae]|uniref:hypothetical protein n=1 Tax=Pseudomonadaceae TaxID=135621 RepID=UPI001AD99273|nr:MULTISPECIES: hypothetical protein [Pseudomonas aeruginosa group]EKU6308734.1 hypothetical protein [Pseudomonas aeruginosa]EKX2970312.1 hypothetical protein [Pseudomonas aeruginosa]MBO8337256.1 hypothetical protein [Pseudomonas aeruginosa]BDC78505.1 hypothetical protein MRCP2_p2400 [Pseudomonas alcaligenes]HBO6962548.1 hypothetical protein [Pseudomonas aeruginosa]
MSEVSKCLSALVGAINFITSYEKASTLASYKEMVAAKTMIESTGALSANVRNQADMGMATALVSFEGGGLVLERWVPELKNQGMSFEALRLEKAALAVRDSLLTHLTPVADAPILKF